MPVDCKTEAMTRTLSGNVIDWFAAGNLILVQGTDPTCNCHSFTAAEITSQAGVASASICANAASCAGCAISDATSAYQVTVPLGPNAHIRFTNIGPDDSYVASTEVAEVPDALWDGTVINFDPGDQWRHIVRRSVLEAAASAAGLTGVDELLARGVGIIQIDPCAMSGNRYGLNPNITVKAVGAISLVFRASYDRNAPASHGIVLTKTPATGELWPFPLGIYIGDGTQGPITISMTDPMDPAPPLVFQDVSFANKPGSVLYAVPNFVQTESVNGGCLPRFQ
jgi:hypothetical protein